MMASTGLQAIYIQTERDVDILRETGFAVKQQGLTTNDHVGNDGLIERRGDSLKQRLKHCSLPWHLEIHLQPLPED